VTYDLSANRSWTISAGISGSGASGQVAYWDGTTSQTGSANFTWNNAGRTLTISGADANQIINQTNAASASAIIFNESSVLKGFIQYVGSTFSVTNRRQLLEIQGSNGIAFRTAGENARLYSTGNLALGDPTNDTGNRLQVVGTTLLNGNVTFSSATGMFWDATNSRLGIGTNTPTNDLSIVKTSAAAGEVGIYLRNLTASGSAFNAIYNDVNESGAFQIFGSTFAATSFRNTLSVVSTTANGIAFLANSNNANAHIKFVTTTSLTERMRIVNSTGNVLIQNGGTFLDTGQRLQVTGDTLLRGSGADSGTFALTAQNSAGTNTFRVRNDGYILIGQASTSAAPAIYAFEGTTGLRSLRIGIQSAGSLTPIPAFNINQESNYTYTSGTGEFTTITANFLPTSGTGTLAYLSIKGTINQTGGANGITRGLYVNPTLTAAADWRSIEWSNNSGWGLYGAGTANNYLGGNLLLGSTTDTGERLQVTGTMKVTGASSFGGNASFSTGTSSQGTLIVPSNATLYTSSTGINTHAIYNSATSITSDVWVGYVSGSAATNIYTYFQAGGYIGTRGGLKIGASSGSDVLSVLSNSWLRIGAGTTTRSQISLASSTAPTSPNDGDIWFDGTDIKMRIGGVTKTFTLI
jgi:hypothetical protein